MCCMNVTLLPVALPLPANPFQRLLLLLCSSTRNDGELCMDSAAQNCHWAQAWYLELGGDPFMVFDGRLVVQH